MRHILTADQITREMLDRMHGLTNAMRKRRQSKDGALWLKQRFPHRRAMVYFPQKSSRTKQSFISACQDLGMDLLVLDDPNTSSEGKGESKLDSIRTFSSFADLIIMRTKIPGLATAFAEHLDTTPRPRPVINGGTGADQHPTQAMLDDYTLRRSLKEYGGIDGKTIVLVGDLKRGRTVRSLAPLMRFYKDVKLILVSPPEFAMEQDVLDILDEHGVEYQITDDFDWAVSQADAVYLTRVQDEHDDQPLTGVQLTIDGKTYVCDTLEMLKDDRAVLTFKQMDIPSKELAPHESVGESVPGFNFGLRHLDILGPRSIVMHPLPRRGELDPACDFDPRIKIWRAVRNGMHCRTALIYRIMREQELEKGYGGPIPRSMQDSCWLLT